MNFFYSLLLVVFFLFSSCANQGLMKSGAEAEYNSYYIAKLRIGMTEDEVYGMMGQPYKIEKKTFGSQPYTIWYYITKGKILGQTKVLSRNLTPLVFQDKLLKGWGKRYYNYILDIDHARDRYESRERQQYTDDRDEWAPDEHGYVPSPYEQKKEGNSSKKDNSSEEESKSPYTRENKHSLWDEKKSK